MFSQFVTFLQNLASTIIGFFLAILFIFIPTATFNPKQHIPVIEQDLSISIPAEYVVIDYYRDWLGFETSEEVQLQFSEESFEELIKQVETNSAGELGSWKKENDEYVFTIHPEVLTEKRYTIEAKLSNSENMLWYKFAEL